MDILVLSDSHGRRDRLPAVLRQLNFRPGAILFLGDGLRDLQALEEDPLRAEIPCYAVCGNCDGFFGMTDGTPDERLLTLGGKKIMLLHGHRWQVRLGPEAAALHAVKAGADVLLFGHTHVPYEATWQAGERSPEGSVLPKSLLIANPGSIGEPRDGGPPRFGILTIRGEQVAFSLGEWQP